ncbi:MAG TPA: shikimate dehydrogenase [Pyrinomonadaceae bacterium]
MKSDNPTRVCIPLNEQSFDSLRVAIQKASATADLIELRLDGLPPDQLELAVRQLDSLLVQTDKPVILTLRTQAQGGYRTIDHAERVECWNRLFSTKRTLFDLEEDLVAELINRDEVHQPDWSRVICSHHDFTGTPSDLDDLYERLSFTPARIIKLALKANDITDCLPILKLLDRARSEERDLIAIAMGDAGVVTRILGPARGAFLTYGALETEQGTAPGQVVATDLKTIYRIDQIDDDTIITGLVGRPVMHSVSPHMHNAAFRSVAINGVYLPFEVNDLDSFIQRLVNPETRELEWNLRGLSVTAPHKSAIMKHLDWIDPTAKSIGAVNTVVVENEQLHGYNTDADGLIAPLIQRLGSLSGLRAAVIGSGGAARAAVFGLQQKGVDVSLFARNLEKAEAFATQFNISFNSLSTSSSLMNFDVVINATPLGSFGERINETPVVAEQLSGSRLVYDLVYNPIETEFLKEGRKASCDVLGGLEMLVAQAKLQFKLWTNTDISSNLMYNAASSSLQKNS